MALRIYLLPMVDTGTVGHPRLVPKYDQTDLAGLERSLLVYGAEMACLAAVDVTPEQHAVLVAEPDVLGLPANLDQAIGAQLQVVQNALGALNIPDQWVQDTHTYRQVLRVVATIFLVLSRFQQFQLARLFASGITLATRFNQLPVAVRTALQDTATDLGLDTSGITGTMTLRQILKALADQTHFLEVFLGAEVI